MKTESKSNVTSAKRFAIFLPHLFGGGAERAMVNLAHGLLDRGFTVDLVLGLKKGPYLANVRPEVNVIDLGTNKMWDKVKGLAKYMKEYQPRGLVSSLDNINIASIAKWRAGVATRVIINVQNHVTTDLASYKGFKAWMKPKVLRFMYKKADEVICVSHGVADDLIDMGLPKSLVGVIHNPVMNANIDALAAEPVDHPFLKPGMPPVLVAVGRLTLQKDYPNMLQAFAAVRRRGHDLNLLILGQGELKAQIEAQIEQLELTDHVSLAGFAANPYAYISKARMFVLSSQWEGLPTVVMEALACGTPVVSTDCPSGPYEILDKGAFGELCPVNDAIALADAIERSLSKPVDSQRLKDRAKIYAADLAIDKYIDVLDPPARDRSRDAAGATTPLKASAV